MDTLFSHVNVVTMNEQMTLWQDAFVGVTDGKIAYMAKKPPEEKPKKIIDATGMVLMPGLINCHTHLPMYLLRGYADDLNLQDWLQHYIFPREDRLDGRAVKAATTLGACRGAALRHDERVGYVLLLRRDLPDCGRVRNQSQYFPRHVHVPGR